MEIQDFQVDQAQPVHLVIEATLDHGDPMERRERQETRAHLDQKVNQVTKEMLALLAWWEPMDHLDLRCVIKHYQGLINFKGEEGM